MRTIPLAAAILLLAATVPARAARFGLPDGSTIAAEAGAGLGFSLLMLPLAAAYALPHSGWENYPYDDSDGYGGGTRDAAFEARYERQFLQKGRAGHHGLFRVHGGARLGWDFALSSYAKEALSSPRRVGYYNGHLTANFLQDGYSVLDFGMGVANIQAARNRFGPSTDLSYEWYPGKPWNLFARYETSLLEGRLYHDFSGGVGAAWGWLGLDAGYRAFLQPLKNAYGPEASIRVWF